LKNSEHAGWCYPTFDLSTLPQTFGNISSYTRKRTCEAFPFGCLGHRALGVGCSSSHNSNLPYHRPGFDEPCHISATLEWLDRHTYKLDPVHPPLARVAIGLPLLLAGERYPSQPSDDPDTQNYNVVGNQIIYGSGHFARTLALARSGMLPFLVLEIVLVFLWARREFGDLAGVLAAALISTLPIVLAFAGVAYTDLPASCMQFALFFAFATWLAKPTTRSTVWLGIAAGFALLSKFTILLFFSGGRSGSRPLQVAAGGTQRTVGQNRSSCVGRQDLDSGDDYHCRALGWVRVLRRSCAGKHATDSREHAIVSALPRPGAKHCAVYCDCGLGAASARPA
jgi:hypothetical protein